MFRRSIVAAVAAMALVGAALFGSTDSALAHECNPWRTTLAYVHEVWLSGSAGNVKAATAVVRAEDAYTPHGPSESSIMMQNGIAYIQAGFRNDPSYSGPRLWAQTRGNNGTVNDFIAGVGGTPASPVGITEGNNYAIEIAYDYPNSSWFQVKINGVVWFGSYFSGGMGVATNPVLNAGVAGGVNNQAMGTAYNLAYTVAAQWYNGTNWVTFSGVYFTTNTNSTVINYSFVGGGNYLYTTDGSTSCQY